MVESTSANSKAVDPTVGSKVIVTQVRGTNRSSGKIVKTMQALGLGRIGRSCEHVLTPSTLGMIRAVQHIVDVREAN